MTASAILILSAIVFAFLLFGGVLAWADRHSRPVRRPQQPTPPQAVRPAAYPPPGHRDAA